MTEFNWPLMKDTITFGDRMKLAKHCIFGDRFTQGKQVEAFEIEWSEWLGCKHSLFVSSGSTANFLLIAAIKELYNLQPGDIVLVPATTWTTSVSPIIQLGLTPVFVDVNLSNFGFCENSLKRVKTLYKDRVKVVFTCHLLGFAGDTFHVKELFPNAIHIDDVCESHGCIDGDRVGSDSIGATFSFYYGHHMSTIEGGMISTNNIELYDLMRMKRSHGMSRESVLHRHKIEADNPDIDNRFLFYTDGYNFRNTELAAILGREQLKRLTEYIWARNANFVEFTKLQKMYCKNHLYDIQYKYGMSSFCFPLICKSKQIKENLRRLLDREKIESRPIIGGNLTRHPYLKNYDFVSVHSLPNANIIHDNGLYIGNNHFVGDKEMKMLEKILKELSDG